MDLTTLHSYFKSVAMQYAPSLASPIGPIGKQAFDVNLQLKDIEPVTALVAPKLTVHRGALMNARFSSADGTATINLIVPELSYGIINVRSEEHTSELQ